MEESYKAILTLQKQPSQNSATKTPSPSPAPAQLTTQILSSLRTQAIMKARPPLHFPLPFPPLSLPYISKHQHQLTPPTAYRNPPHPRSRRRRPSRHQSILRPHNRSLSLLRRRGEADVGAHVDPATMGGGVLWEAGGG